MNRRHFLQTSSLASSLLLVPRFLHALDHGSGLGGLRDARGRRLLVVQLSGGNDGLNTIVPFRNDLYYQARPTLALRAADGLLPLSDELALHPSMARLKTLHDQGQLAVLNAVGYPNPDRSHFRSMDIWQTGSGSGQTLSTGWLGRYLDGANPAGHPYPEGLEVDDTLSLALKGQTRKGLALKNPARFHQLTQSRLLSQLSHAPGPAGTHSHPHEAPADYLYQTLAETASAADYLYDKARIYKSTVSYPDTPFGKSLKTTAELINAGVESRVYYAALGGFDTHVRQHEQQGRLLQNLSDSLGALADDLRQAGNWQDTLVLVFSEFGRRVAQNASRGSDHGTANPVLLLGGALKNPGILNAAPNLADLDADGDLRHQVDFRGIYAPILKDWLGADEAAILGRDFEAVRGLV